MRDSINVIASAAKQSTLSFRCKMDCFASLAMTAETIIAREGGRSSIPETRMMEAIGHNQMDCFAEPVIGRAFARPVGSQ